MCGIVGAVDQTGAQIDEADLVSMISCLPHRGPDGRGVWCAREGVGLGHVRLSIIDIEGGAQPMQTADGQLTLVFNGQIYNHVELRDELRGNYKFRTRSDTEVILAAYLKYGPECVQHFNGQWAFAISDKQDKSLFISRDRIGVRPLFYTNTASTFVFASEIKALLRYPHVKRELNIEAIAQTFTYWYSLPPQTSFKGIFELPPGHSLLLKDGCTKVTQHWTPDFFAYSTAPKDIPVERQVDELEQHLQRSIELRLRSDVPVGCYLSGGLDSSLTTAMVRRVVNGELHTFSVRFPDGEYDESPYQELVAGSLGTTHHSIECRDEDIASHFPDVVWHTEMPLVRTAPVPLYLLSSLVRQHNCKVVITGEGADEVFGGYDIFKEAKIKHFCAAASASSGRVALLKRLYPYAPQLQKQSTAYLQEFFNNGDGGETDLLSSHRARWNNGLRNHVFFAPELRERFASSSSLDVPVLSSAGQWDFFSRAQYLETTGLLPGYILSAQGDRPAMAHSVEVRHPFLDVDVVGFASRLDPRMRMFALREKFLLKKLAAKYLPGPVVARHKQPYRAPEGQCFFSSSHDYVNELLSPERLKDDGIFDPRAVELLVKKFKDSRTMGFRENMALVGILSTQLLNDAFVRGKRL